MSSSPGNSARGPDGVQRRRRPRHGRDPTARARRWRGHQGRTGAAQEAAPQDSKKTHCETTQRPTRSPSKVPRHGGAHHQPGHGGGGPAAPNSLEATTCRGHGKCDATASPSREADSDTGYRNTSPALSCQRWKPPARASEEAPQQKKGRSVTNTVWLLTAIVPELSIRRERVRGGAPLSATVTRTASTKHSGRQLGFLPLPQYDGHRSGPVPNHRRALLVLQGCARKHSRALDLQDGLLSLGGFL